LGELGIGRNEDLAPADDGIGSRPHGVGDNNTLQSLVPVVDKRRGRALNLRENREMLTAIGDRCLRSRQPWWLTDPGGSPSRIFNSIQS
jgi:hypothetical protein